MKKVISALSLKLILFFYSSSVFAQNVVFKAEYLDKNVDAYGGIGSPKVANAVNPIWPYNPQRPVYLAASYALFGSY